jgi:DNA-binding response OmpR family regulator
MKILIVEDDTAIAQTLADVLTKQHYVVDVAADGELGRQYAMSADYDLMLLDVMLPKLDGISLCRQLRQAGHQMLILLLTARDTATDKVLGLDAGADDYVIKPFDFQELSARIRALLRRGNASTPTILQWGNLCLDLTTYNVSYGDRKLQLTSTEYRLLELFLRNSRRVFSRSAIVDHLWTTEDPPQEATIKSYIKTLRRKLVAAGAPPDLIETVYGLGYRLNPAHEQVSASIEQQTELAVIKARESFRSKLSDRLMILEQATQALEQNCLDETLRQQAEHEAHKLTGALGTFDLPEGSHWAEAIEDLFQANPSIEHAQTLRQWMNNLCAALDYSTTVISEQSIPLLLVMSQEAQQTEQLIKEAALWNLRLEVGFSEQYTSEESLLTDILVQKPDVVLLDLDGMPMQVGLSLLSKLVEQSVPVLVWTDRDCFGDRVEVARRGGQGFLLKSMSANQILEIVAQKVHRLRSTAKILIVDDDSEVLTMIQRLLTSAGLQLTTLETPQQFWDTFLDYSPDLVILDVEMPHFNGIELCRVLRNDPRWQHLPVLFFTAHTDTETVHRIFTAGATDCIAKSTTRSQLLTRIVNCLRVA